MKLILYQATIAITGIDFVPGPFRCQIELGHLDFAVVRLKQKTGLMVARAVALRININSDGRQIPTKKAWRTSTSLIQRHYSPSPLRAFVSCHCVDIVARNIIISCKLLKGSKARV